ncbi:MAG: AAA family ATPase [Elusimicrobia bacterium]|nr:AAA family ATPase [Elusimicrobiota bacterium]
MPTKKVIATVTALACFFSFITSPFLEASSLNHASVGNSRQHSENSLPQVTPQDQGGRIGPSSLLRESLWSLVGRQGWRVEGRLLPFITQIEDNHGDTPSQLAAVHLLDKVDSERGNEPLLIGVEGAWDILDISPLAALPPGEWRNRWFNRLLWRGDLTGEEYWMLMRSPTRVTLIGIDDPVLHQQHSEARRIVETSRKETELFLRDLATRVDRLKKHLFPPAWVILDKAFSDYDEGSISINELSVSILEKVSPTWMNENTPHLFYLAQIHKNPVDPKSVQKELKDMLSFTLTPAESQQLFSGSPMKNPDVFFNNIFAMADARKLTLPHTKKYAQQSLWSREIEPMALSKEVNVARRSLFTSSPSHPVASKLVQIKETLFLLRGIVALGLTPDDWLRFQTQNEFNDIQNLSDSIRELESNKWSREPRSPIPFSSTYVIQNAKRFYELAKLRDHAMADNLIKQARRVGATRSVVIAGGFHTPGMVHLFRQWGAPFEVLCPIPEHKVEPTLRALDAFQQPETRNRILHETATQLQAEENDAVQRWMNKLSSQNRRHLRKAGFGEPQALSVFWTSLKKDLTRWAYFLALFLREQWDFFQTLHGSQEKTAWAVLTAPIPPVMNLIPPSIHQTPAEYAPPLPQRESGEKIAEEFQSLVQQSRWVEAENFLWQLWTGHGSARLIGESFMALNLTDKEPRQARDLVASHLSPQALGLLGQGLMDYFQDRDLERLYERRKLNQTLLDNLNAIESNRDSAIHGIKTTLSQINQSLLDEANGILGVDSEGTPGFTLMDPMDPDTDAVVRQVKKDGEETTFLANKIKNLMDQWDTESSPDLLQETKKMVGKIKLHFQPTIKKILLPTATDHFTPAGQTRAKLSAYREWLRFTQSMEVSQRELARRAWRSAETLSRSIAQGKLADPTAYSTPLDRSAFGKIAVNRVGLDQTLSTLRTQERPIVVVSLPYEEAKNDVIQDLAHALTTTSLSTPGPRRLLRVRLSRLESDPKFRATALKLLMERAGELGGTALAIDLDEVGPLLENVEKPLEHLLQSWAGLDSPPPLVFISASRAHQDLLNTGGQDKSDVVTFPPSRDSVKSLLQTEAERIQTTSSCEIQPEVVSRLVDAVFSTGTVDFSEAIKSLRWAAAQALIHSASNGTPPVVTPHDLTLQEDARLRDLPLARQVRIVVGRVDDLFAQALNNLLANFESLSPNSPFYSSVEARLRHAVGLWHMFPKETNSSKEVRLSQEEIDTGVSNAWSFFNAHLMGLERQKQAVIDTYIKHELEQQGKSPHAPSDILCLVGPHGTGKTEIASLLAQYLKRKLIKIDAGGASSEEQILGTMSTFVGSQPGKIHLALEEEETDELVLLIDEIDKGSPVFWNALIQLLEKNQPLDSRYDTFKTPKRRIVIIATANDWSAIPDALKSRLQQSNFSEFSPSGLKRTAALFTWPKVAKRFEFPDSWARCDDPYPLISLVVDDYLERPALRELERIIERIHRAANLVAIDLDHKYHPVVMDEAFVRELLGSPVQRPQHMVRGDTPGQLSGLGVMGSGVGVTMPIQVIALPLEQVPGTPLLMTGGAAETMQASGQNALEALRGRSRRHPSDFDGSLPLSEIRLHVHLPPLQSEKDGPSAGMAMAVAAYSEITQRQVNPAIAITGGLLPNGQSFAVGGISEKIQAARIEGKSIIFIPSGNENDLKTHLERQNSDSEPVAIVSGGETTFFFNGEVDLQGISEEKIRRVPGGIYIRATDSPHLSADRQPTTVVLTKWIDDILDYPDAILPRGTIIPPLQKGEITTLTPRVETNQTSNDSEQDKGKIPVTPPEPTPSRNTIQGSFIPDNVYNRSASTPLSLSTGETMTPSEFLQMNEADDQLNTLERLLKSDSTEALPLFEALTRALWVLDPTRAGAIFNKLFNTLDTQNLLFPPSPRDDDGLGVPFLAHMVAAQDRATVDKHIYRKSNFIKILEGKLNSLKRYDANGTHSIQEKIADIFDFIVEDYDIANETIEELPAELKNDLPHIISLRLYWENRRNQLLNVLNQRDHLLTMIEEAGTEPSPESLVKITEAYRAILRSTLNFKVAERRHMEEHRATLMNDSLRHPLLKAVGEESLVQMLIQVVDQTTRRTARKSRELGREASRLADIQLNLARLTIPIMGNYLKDHSNRSARSDQASPLQSISEWAKPAASATAEIVSSIGNRVLTVVCPSNQRRLELPQLIADQLHETAELPLSAKSNRVLSLNFSKNHTTNAAADFELMEPIITQVRETESAILYIDLTSLKSWAGSDYFVVMKRLLRAATEESTPPPLPLIFGSDRETHTQTNNTINRYGATAHTLQLPDPTAGEIVALLNNRARALIDSKSPVRFAETLWKSALDDGRLPIDLDECLAVFNQVTGKAIQEKRTEPVDNDVLNSVIKLRVKQKNTMDSILNRAEREIPLIPDPVAKRRGEEFLARLKALDSSDAESVIVSNYLEWLLKWDWNPAPAPIPTLEDMAKLKARAIRIMDQRIYGQHKLKRRILEMYMGYLWQLHQGKNPKLPVIALLGPYGAGKTTAASVIAEVFNFVFKKFSMAAENDPRRIRGFEHYVVGAQPGIPYEAMTDAMQQAKREREDPTKTPDEIHESGKVAFLIDEIDKGEPGHLGDPRNALYPLMDPEQRHHVEEIFFGIPWNYSNMMVITTLNDENALLPSLRDRMEEIYVPLLEDEETVGLASDMLLDRIATEKNIVLTDGQDLEDIDASLSARVLDFGTPQEKADLFRDFIDGWAPGGPRELGRAVSALLNSALDKNSAIAAQAGYAKVPPFKVRKENLPELLGSRRQGDPRAQALSPIATAGEALFYGESNQPGGTSVWSRETPKEPARLLWPRGELEESRSPRGGSRQVTKIKEMLQIVWTVAQKRFSRNLAGNRFMVEFQGAPSGPSGDEALATFAALASRAFNHALGKETAFFGEIEATGKIREVGQDMERRLRRARADGVSRFHLNARNDDLLSLMHKHPRLAGFLQRGDQVSLCLPNREVPNTEEWKDPDGVTFSKRPIHSPLPGSVDNTVWSEKATKAILDYAKTNGLEKKYRAGRGIIEITAPKKKNLLKLLKEAGISEQDVPQFFLANSVDEVLTHLDLPPAPPTDSNQGLGQGGFFLIAIIGVTMLAGLMGFAFLGETTTALSLFGITASGPIQVGDFLPMAQSLGIVGLPLLSLSIYNKLSLPITKREQEREPRLRALLAFSEGLVDSERALLKSIVMKEGSNDITLNTLSTREIQSIHQMAAPLAPRVQVPFMGIWLSSRGEILNTCEKELIRRGSRPQTSAEDFSISHDLIPRATPVHTDPSRTLEDLRVIKRQV